MTVDVPAHRYTNGGRIDRSCQLGWPTWFAPKTESGGFFTRFKAEGLVSIAVVIQRLQKRRMLKLSCLKVSHSFWDDFLYFAKSGKCGKSFSASRIG